MREKLLLIINEMLEESDLDCVDHLEDSMSLRDDLSMDSLMLAELTVRIEDEFKVDIFADSIVYTIGDIIFKIEG